MNPKITVQSVIDAPVEKVWSDYTEPKAIQEWNSASEDWHCPAAENDVRVGGRFKSTMAARDGSQSFDFSGEYEAVEIHKKLTYVMDDGRRASVSFDPEDGKTRVTVTFDAEDTYDAEMQREGWQSILDNFARFAEKND